MHICILCDAVYEEPKCIYNLCSIYPQDSLTLALPILFFSLLGGKLQRNNFYKITLLFGTVVVSLANSVEKRLMKLLDWDPSHVGSATVQRNINKGHWTLLG